MILVEFQLFSYKLKHNLQIMIIQVSLLIGMEIANYHA
jgi:hypothetical protein